MQDRLVSPAVSNTQAAPGLTQRFSFLVNLLGGDILIARRDSVGKIVSETIAQVDGPVALSSDLLRLAPELESLESRAGDSWTTAVSRARLGVAATGSVLIAEHDEIDRVLPVLARRHIVLLPAGAIVPTLDDAAPALLELAGSGVRYLTFVSGPSRTADIEKILTIGAHGPQSLLIVIVEDWAPEGDPDVDTPVS